MHKLGEQWVEEIDGQEHMLKVVEQAKTVNADVCGGCYFGVCGDICHDGALHVCGYGEGKCPLDNVDWVVKDLGILNEDGCLPSPWGGYPKIIHEVNQTRIENGEDVHYGNLWCVEIHEPVLVCTDEYPTKQEAIDAWNRRA